MHKHIGQGLVEYFWNAEMVNMYVNMYSNMNYVDLMSRISKW
jgi:hypothetical protein